MKSPGVTGNGIDLMQLQEEHAAPVELPAFFERRLTDSSSDGQLPYDIENEFEALTKESPSKDMAKLKMACSNLVEQVVELQQDITKLKLGHGEETAMLEADKESAWGEIRSLRGALAQLKAVAEAPVNALPESA